MLQSYLVLNETTGVAALEAAIDDLICAKPAALKTSDHQPLGQVPLCGGGSRWVRRRQAAVKSDDGGPRAAAAGVWIHLS